MNITTKKNVRKINNEKSMFVSNSKKDNQSFGTVLKKIMVLVFVSGMLFFLLIFISDPYFCAVVPHAFEGQITLWSIMVALNEMDPRELVNFADRVKFSFPPELEIVYHESITTFANIIGYLYYQFDFSTENFSFDFVEKMAELRPKNFYIVIYEAGVSYEFKESFAEFLKEKINSAEKLNPGEKPSDALRPGFFEVRNQITSAYYEIGLKKSPGYFKNKNS